MERQPRGSEAQVPLVFTMVLNVTTNSPLDRFVTWNPAAALPVCGLPDGKIAMGIAGSPDVRDNPAKHSAALNRMRTNRCVRFMV
jgi:hypothetical protein